MSAAKRGLGTGLEALFGDDLSQQEPEGVRDVPIAKVEPRQDQPRTSFDEEALSELAESIREYGLIQPITVRKLDSGYYQIIAGERRWRASRMAGLSQVPVRIIEADERLATELALVENLQREDLNPMEEARGYRKLIDDYGLTQDEAARRVGKSRPSMTNAMRLLGLSPAVMAMVEAGQLSAGHARALLPVLAPELQAAAANTVLSKGLSVRKTEELARRLAKEPPAPKNTSGEIKVDYFAEVERQLERSLGRKVRITESGKGGRITIEYYGADDREAIIQKLAAIK